MELGPGVIVHLFRTVEGHRYEDYEAAYEAPSISGLMCGNEGLTGSYLSGFSQFYTQPVVGIEGRQYGEEWDPEVSGYDYIPPSASDPAGETRGLLGVNQQLSGGTYTSPLYPAVQVGDEVAVWQERSDWIPSLSGAERTDIVVFSGVGQPATADSPPCPTDTFVPPTLPSSGGGHSAEPPNPPCKHSARCDRPPVAEPDSFVVDAGETLEGSVLANDRDPDGDPIHAKVLKISFAHGEWSGLEPDGTFFYTAGPGTQLELQKKVTYEAVDSYGASSAPVVAMVTVRPRGRRTGSPLTPRRARSARLAASASDLSRVYWDGGWASATLCFGGGLDSSCYTMNSVANTQALDRETSSFPSLGSAVRWCTKFQIIPKTPEECGKELIKKGIGFAWNRSVLYNAAKFGDCLLSRVHRHRTITHPLSGTWSKPEYETLRSLVSPWSGNATVSGWGTWGKGFSGEWRVPLFCGSNGLVYRLVGKELVDLH
jgi:hypothetical protein